MSNKYNYNCGTLQVVITSINGLFHTYVTCLMSFTNGY